MFESAPFPHQFSDRPSADRLAASVAYRFAEADEGVSGGIASRSEPALARAGVRQIVLMHGTFVGNDFMGLLRQLSRFSPRLSRSVRDLSKQWVDQFTGEVGNYTGQFADCLSNIVNGHSDSRIVVSRFHWSGENHHLGRGCAAAKLLMMLSDQSWGPNDRVLFFAHSHAGNVLAMLSLVLGAERETREAFADLLSGHWEALADDRAGGTPRRDLRACLVDDDALARLPQLDVVTFGTPLRYRWNQRIFPRLLHFIQHRPRVTNKPYVAALPTSVADLQSADAGDYVQHFGIGGTDLPPTLWNWSCWRDNRGLAEMFEANTRRRDLGAKLSRGERISLDGATELVDYGPDGEARNLRLFGHGVYTCRPWLPFHLRVIAETFYG